MKFLEGKKKPISDVSRGQRKNAHSHEKHHHLLTQSGRIAPRRLQPAHSHMGTMQMRDFFAPPPPYYFFSHSPAVFGGPLAVFLPERFFLLPLLGEETLLSLAHRPSRGVSAGTTLCANLSGRRAVSPSGWGGVGAGGLSCRTYPRVTLVWFGWGFFGGGLVVWFFFSVSLLDSQPHGTGCGMMSGSFPVMKSEEADVRPLPAEDTTA